MILHLRPGDFGILLGALMEKRLQVEQAPEQLINAALEVSGEIMRAIGQAPPYANKADYLATLKALEERLLDTSDPSRSQS